MSGALWKSSNRRAESMFPTRKGGKLASKGPEASTKFFHEEGFKGRATGRVVDVLQGGLGGGIDASRASSVGAVFLPQHGYWAAEGRLQELKSVGAPLPFGLKLLQEAEELGLRAGIPQIPLRREGKSNGSSKQPNLDGGRPFPIGKDGLTLDALVVGMRLAQVSKVSEANPRLHVGVHSSDGRLEGLRQVRAPEVPRHVQACSPGNDRSDGLRLRAESSCRQIRLPSLNPLHLFTQIRGRGQNSWQHELPGGDARLSSP